MRLLDLTLRRVRRHRELQLAFDPGFTLIGGANESGKSTLVEALHKGLFLKASATGRGVEELRSRLHPGLPEVEIGFAAAGRHWRLRKRFAGSAGTCQLSHDGGLSLSGAEAEEQLAQLLGVEGAVEGRRIAQLPLRWGHLWVRQGEAGSNLLDAPPEAYDLGRLVEQLQRLQDSGSATWSALESPLDRRVIDSLRQQLDQQFTATGKVRAGSPLALARQRHSQLTQQLQAAEARLEQLEGSLEALRSNEERWQEIERQILPALEQLRRGESQRQGLWAELKPLEEQHQHLEQRLAEITALQRQLQAQAQSRQRLEQESQQQQAALATARERIAALDHRSRALAEQLEGQAAAGQLAQLLLDQHQLEREEAQRLAHQSNFDSLQQQAEALKQRLAALAVIGPEQLTALRQAQRQLSEAEAHRQAKAVHLELLAADQTVQLDGAPLEPGRAVELLQRGELTVGSGVRLRLSPGAGGGPQAQQHWQGCLQALKRQLQTLQVQDLEEAEAIASQRTALEAELQQLRQAASAIPWARLQQDAEEQQLRRQRLSAALQRHGAQHGPARSREELELWREELSATTAQLEQQRRQSSTELEDLRRGLAEQERQQRQRDQQLQQLLGSQGALEEQQQRLLRDHGEPAALEAQLSQIRQGLDQRRTALDTLTAELREARERSGLNLPAAIASAVEEQLAQVQAEKETLLLQRGQHQQTILSLSAEDPAAAVEQQQAALEEAEAEQHQLELQAQALQELMRQFDAARSQLASRFSLPLSQAVGRYLEALACPDYTPALDYDPSQGFSNLQLRQGGEGFRFEELSGGMREQLNGALRLAIAEALAPAYDGSLPLLFDDAFTNTDPQRQEGLQTMLRRAMGQGLQVVLLSCTPELYGGLLQQGGQRHRLEA